MNRLIAASSAAKVRVCTTKLSMCLIAVKVHPCQSGDPRSTPGSVFPGDSSSSPVDPRSTPPSSSPGDPTFYGDPRPTLVIRRKGPPLAIRSLYVRV